MNDRLLLALKSTLDKILNDQATALEVDFPRIDFSEVDDLVQVQEKLGTSAPALIYAMANPAPAPRAPLFLSEFAVGAKTVQDQANYKLAELVSRLQAIFTVGARIEVRDYSGTSGVAPLIANLCIVSVAPEYPRLDAMAGVRLFAVTARGAEVPT